MDSATFFSANILADIAHKAAERSISEPDSNLVAALFSAAWVEGALNELVYDLTTVDESQLAESLREAKRTVIATDLFESRSASIELKLNILCAATTGHQLDWGSQPWQRVALLLQVRNWLVHLRPERMKVRPGSDEETSSIVSTEVAKLVTSLKASGAIADIPQGRIVPVAIATRLPGVGVWAYRAAYDCLVAVSSWHTMWRRVLLFAAREPIEV